MTEARDLNTDLRPKQLPTRHSLFKRSLLRTASILGSLTLALALVGCELTDKMSMGENSEKSKTELPEALNRCPEQRPQMCTQQYDPACGYFDPQEERESVNHTYGNSCTACTHEEVIGFIPGECLD